MASKDAAKLKEGGVGAVSSGTQKVGAVRGSSSRGGTSSSKASAKGESSGEQSRRVVASPLPENGGSAEPIDLSGSLVDDGRESLDKTVKVLEGLVTSPGWSLGNDGVGTSPSGEEVSAGGEEQDQEVRTARASTVVGLLEMVNDALKTHQRVNDVCFSDKSKISKVAGNQIMEEVSSLVGTIAVLSTVLGAHIGREAAQSDSSTSGNKLDGAAGEPVMTYANAARVEPVPVRPFPHGAPVPARPERKVVLVRSAKNGDTAPTDNSGIEKELLEVLKPVEGGIRVKKVVGVKAGGLLIVAQDEASKNKILEAGKSVGTLTFSAPLGERPRLRLFDVPASLGGRDLVEAIALQNFDLADRDAIKGEVSAIHRTGPKREAKCDWVLKVTHRVRDLFLRKKRLFVELGSCRVVDHVRVAACYRCLKYGHIASRCQQKDPTCRHCGESGHIGSGCPRKDVAPRCSNCRERGLIGEHKADSLTCPVLQAVVKRKVDRTTYADEGQPLPDDRVLGPTSVEHEVEVASKGAKKARRGPRARSAAKSQAPEEPAPSGSQTNGTVSAAAPPEPGPRASVEGASVKGGKSPPALSNASDSVK